MKKIKEMIESAPTRKMAVDALNAMQIFGDITESQFEKGRKLIRKEFAK